jgi:hypothetical protein
MLKRKKQQDANAHPFDASLLWQRVYQRQRRPHASVKCNGDAAQGKPMAPSTSLKEHKFGIGC